MKSLLLASALLWALITFAPIGGSHADSWGSLLAAQALVETGSTELSRFSSQVDLNNYSFAHLPQGIFFSYPPGAVYLSVPAVAIAKLFGLNMAIEAQESLLQRQMSALASVAQLWVLVYGLRALFSPGKSLALALLMLLGGAYTGALSNCFNSQVPAIWCVTASQALLLRHAYAGAPLRPGLQGALLALAYISRPTGILWAPFALFYMVRRGPRQLPWALLSLAVGLLLFFASNWYFMGTPRHPYFGGRQLVLDLVGFSDHWVGIWLSPGRGLLVYQPLLLLALLLWPRAQLLPTLFYGYALAHVGVVALQTDWWGGVSYGSRLTAEAVLPLYLCLATQWQRLRFRLLPLLVAPWIGWSLWVNCWPPLFKLTAWAHEEAANYPNDPQLHGLWNWHLAAFWIDAAGLLELRSLTPASPLPHLYRPNPLGFANPQIAGNWVVLHSNSDKSSLSWHTNTQESETQQSLLKITYRAPQAVKVWRNGLEIGQLPPSRALQTQEFYTSQEEPQIGQKLNFQGQFDLFDVRFLSWSAKRCAELEFTNFGGWENSPEDGRFQWAMGPQADIHFQLRQGGPLQLKGQMESHLPGQRCGVYQQGKLLKELELQPGWQDFELKFSGEVGSNRLDLKFSTWREPFSPPVPHDGRQLACRWRNLDLTRR